MTLKTSLFNKGIYKSTLKRYMWGSVLYFIILFVITALPIFLAYDPHTIIGYGYPVLYEGYMILGMLFAVAVPTVVGLLVFRFMHSKKTSIFMHSLPVGRTAVYISSVLAALTLMMAPVILNGGILAVMSVAGYGKLLPLTSVLCWTLMNLLALFTMFACTSFVASLTGNSFAMIALSILFHGIIPLATAALSVFAETFLFGFIDVTELLEKVVEGNLIVRLFTRADNFYTFYRRGIPAFGIGNLWEILAAIALFVLAWFFYRKRNLETSEDVAGFKVLNPIFKYLVTFLGAICAFALFSSFIGDNPAMFVFVVFIVSVVAYFATEMILKKTLKVWKCYKGFIAFAAVFTALTCVFAFTSFFGYETRVPSPDRVESVAIYNYYNYDEPYVEDADVIERAINIHKELVSEDKIYTLVPDMNWRTRIHVKYKLKNGKELNRAYWVNEQEKYEILGGLYEFDSYRLANEGIVEEKPEDIYRINFYNNRGENAILTDPEEIKGLHDAICRDLMILDYDEIYNEYSITNMSVNYEISYPENISIATDGPYTEMSGMRIGYANVTVNSNFKNTHEWLAGNGYKEYSYYTGLYGTVYIAEEEALEQTGYRFEVLTAPAPMLKFPDMTGEECVYLGQEEKDRLELFIIESRFGYTPDGKKYSIFSSREEGGYETVGMFNEEEMNKILDYLFE